MRESVILFCAGIVLSFAVAAEGVPAGKSVTWSGGGRGTVVFSGKEHSEKGLKCGACHPGMFKMQKGAATMTMEAMDNGAFCGSCHNGSSAFSTSDTRQCHKCHKNHSREGHREHRDDGRHGEDHPEHHD